MPAFSFSFRNYTKLQILRNFIPTTGHAGEPVCSWMGAQRALEQLAWPT
jgi:hypothetical protein